MSKTTDVRKTAVALAASTFTLALFGMPAAASAQSIIKRPGAHPDYAVEIEPHGVFQWTNRFGANDGLGVGARFNIPFLDNGPVSKINNNMAIGFGLDVTFGDNNCRWWWNRWDRDLWLSQSDCSVTEFWLPVVLQWNFFLTKTISVFGEPGLAFAHRRWDWEWWCGDPNGTICSYDDSDTDLEFVFWGGGRFMFSDSVGATVRLGTPYVSVGLNILL